MEILTSAIDIFLHLDTHLTEFVSQYGTFTYALLFFIIFAETGFVFTPFLPGDSLLFAAGEIAALGSLNIWLLLLLLITAAILGDSSNYWIGHFFGQKIIDNPNIPLINQEHIDKTQQFFKKHGGKTIFLARFVPIVRTFAPFIAGVGSMEYSRFMHFNFFGGIIWVTVFTLAGYLFGNVPFIQHNFHYVIVAIIVLSVIPMIYEYIQNKRKPDVPSVPVTKLKKAVNK